MSVYARILRTPGVAVIVFATLIGRMPIGISGLAILLFVRDVTGSFASAGLCAGALALGSAIGAPLQGRLIDRRGVRMLLPLAALHAAGLLVVLAAGEASAATAALAAASLVAGAATPPVSSVLRSHWPYLLAERPELIPGAYALDSVMIELIFVTGPLVTTVVVATVGAQYALIVSAACAIAGVLLMLGGLRGRPGPSPTAEGGRALGLGALAAPGLRTLVLASLPVGFTLGTIEVVLPAFSAQEVFSQRAGGPGPTADRQVVPARRGARARPAVLRHLPRPPAARQGARLRHLQAPATATAGSTSRCRTGSTGTRRGDLAQPRLRRGRPAGPGVPDFPQFSAGPRSATSG